MERNTYEQGLRDAFVICEAALAALANEGQRVDGGQVCVRLLRCRLIQLGYADPRTWSEGQPPVPTPPTPEELERAERVRRERAAAAAAAAGEAHQRYVEEVERQRQANAAWRAEQCRVDAERKARRRITIMETRCAKERLREPILSGVTPQTTVWDALLESCASSRVWSRLWLLGVSDEATLRDLSAISVSKFTGKNCGKGTLGEVRQMLSSAGLWLAGDEEIDMRDEQ
jgi:hypothetical protein